MILIVITLVRSTSSDPENLSLKLSTFIRTQTRSNSKCSLSIVALVFQLEPTHIVASCD